MDFLQIYAFKSDLALCLLKCGKDRNNLLNTVHTHY